MNTKVIAISIAAFIGIIVLGSVLMPILDDATAKTDTFKNEGYFYMDVVKDDETHTLSWDYTNPGIITVDGSDVALPDGIGNWTICGSKDFMVRYLSQSSNKAINVYALNNQGIHAQVSNSTSMTLEVSADSVTATNTASTPETLTISDLETIYCIVPESGSYVMKYSDKPAYLVDESVIGICRTVADGVSVSYSIFGTIGDGFEINQFYGSTATFGDITVNDTEVSGYNGLYKLDNFQFNITSGTNSTDATVSYFIVPAEVTAERAVHFTDGQNAILAAIPIMIIVAILLGVVALVIRSRTE